MEKKSTLTAKQRQFVAHYLATNNATRAAVLAGYSEKTAYSIGHENLTKPEIRAAIEAHMQQAAMTADQVLYRLSELARADITDLIDQDGHFDLQKARSLQKTGMIKRVHVRVNDKGERTTTVEVHDSLRALELLAKYHNLTNTVRVEDWRSRAIEDIRGGRIRYNDLAEAFDADLATQLFAAAGVPVSTGPPAGKAED